jgi:hypothetical protein
MLEYKAYMCNKVTLVTWVIKFRVLVIISF